ncbi:MAG: hypothetical protein GWP62_03180 [Gammaproteobacteria bacterium]|nr:hypothetical protein [Gammaproteobacteria bacterium]
MSSNRMVVLAMLLFLVSSIGQAAEESSHSEHGEAEHHKNRVAGFIGITGEDRRERALTLAVDYSRMLSPSFGIGIGIERALGDLDFTVLTIPVSYKLNEWKFFVAPGLENADDSDENEFLTRVGIEYGFEMDGYEIAPVFMLDFIDGDVVVIGGVAIALFF